jgi:hypothetical protein
MQIPEEPERVDEILAMGREFWKDCDGNGYPDSLDILLGFADDRNHNGVIDTSDCESDSTVQRSLNPTKIIGPDLWVFHEPVGKIVIRFLVPPPGGQISVGVYLPGGQRRLTELTSGYRKTGSFELTWDPKTKTGDYVVIYRTGGRFFEHKVRWQSTWQ